MCYQGLDCRECVYVYNVYTKYLPGTTNSTAITSTSSSSTKPLSDGVRIIHSKILPLQAYLLLPLIQNTLHTTSPALSSETQSRSHPVDTRSCASVLIIREHGFSIVISRGIWLAGWLWWWMFWVIGRGWRRILLLMAWVLRGKGERVRGCKCVLPFLFLFLVWKRRNRSDIIIYLSHSRFQKTKLMGKRVHGDSQ